VLDVSAFSVALGAAGWLDLLQNSLFTGAALNTAALHRILTATRALRIMISSSGF
jgi:hypothetical protein